MPRFKFKCPKCESVTIRNVSIGTREIECECGDTAVWQMPTLNGSAEVTETVDKNLGTKWRANHRDDIETRKANYFWKHEVPRLVDSGVYGLTTMLEQGWIIVNDKGQIEIQNKPPHKR